MRAIEVGFPIVEINRLAVPERNAFKPIYQMHKWFAWRTSCVFRAILLGAFKPALGPDGKPTDLMDEFYLDHTEDPDTKGKLVLDPFMGGGTTVVEALRLGCNVIGIDLNPVAWFIVKTEIEPVGLDELQAAFERLSRRPVDWNGGQPLKETLLDLYKTEVCPGIEAEIIYTFWVKHAICTDQNCRNEIPLFNNYVIAQKTVSVSYYRDVTCPHCGTKYDWDIEVASLMAETAMMINAQRGSSGEGRPSAVWSYAPITKAESRVSLVRCPHCDVSEQPLFAEKKRRRKKVLLTVVLCPACEAVWQWRGTLPQGDVNCPACKHSYDPLKGNVPDKGKFLCPQCGVKDRIIHSLRILPHDRRLPIRPYALQAYLPVNTLPEPKQRQSLLFESNTEGRTHGSNAIANELQPGLLLPKNGKFFTRFTSQDRARLIEAEELWEAHAEEIVENRTRGKTIASFYEDLAKAFSRIRDGIPEDGLLVFTFHHTDQEGTIWEGLLKALCETGFEIAAVYPIHGESESSLHLMDKENVSYDLIHVCRKRKTDPQTRSWAGIRQEVRRRAREELQAIESGRYGNEPLPPADVRLICIGKCLELFSSLTGPASVRRGRRTRHLRYFTCGYGPLASWTGEGRRIRESLARAILQAQAAASCCTAFSSR